MAIRDMEKLLSNFDERLRLLERRRSGGSGIPGKTKFVPMVVTDWDDATEPGVYFAEAGTPNEPPGVGFTTRGLVFADLNGERITQIVIEATGNVRRGTIYMRYISADGTPLDWQRHTPDGVGGQPYAQAAGQLPSVGVPANSTDITTVTFPIGRFTAAPYVTVSLAGNQNQLTDASVSYNLRSATSVNVQRRNNASVARNIFAGWHAIQID